jgi:steroid 5-alpha reductase family enzyme
MIAPTTVGSSLLVTFLIDAGIQLVFYIISASFNTEQLYDLSGALTYQLCTLIALLCPPPTYAPASPSFRQILVTVLVMVWSLRLGIFLFMRVLRIPDKVY